VSISIEQISSYYRRGKLLTFLHLQEKIALGLHPINEKDRVFQAYSEAISLVEELNEKGMPLNFLDIINILSPIDYEPNNQFH